MMMKCIHIRLSATCLVLSMLTNAQDFSATMHEITKIKNAYQSAAYLSYQMKYLYAKELTPARYLDSLTGNFKMHDSSYYGKIGKIELLQNAVINIAVYNQDKIIMLNKLVKQDDKLMPLASWDSVFVAFNMDTTLITDKGGIRTLEFKFSPAANYKNFVIQYDSKNYLLKKIIITTRQSPADNGPGQVKQDGNMVTILFSGYSTENFDTAIFSAAKYVQQQASQWATTAAYNDFRLVDLRTESSK